MDMSLEEQNKAAEGFNLDDEHEPMPDIWATDSDEASNDDQQVVSSDDVGSEAPARPAFLRRLRDRAAKKSKKTTKEQK
jgi:hypothetical protein